MSTPELPSGHDLEAAARVTEALVDRGFRETDMQFNIARIEGHPRRGFDMVNPATKDRLYITGPSSEVGEDFIRGVMGEHAVLEPAERSETAVVYHVPRGTRLLHKTLRSGPYARPYMQSLALRAYAFLNSLEKMDSEAFGIDTPQLALTHNGAEDDNDDVYITIVPPVADPVKEGLTKENVDRFIHREKATRRLGKLAAEIAQAGLPEKPASPTKDFDLTLIMKYFRGSERGDG